MQNFGDDAFGAEDGGQVFLAQVIGVHQGTQDFYRRSVWDGVMFSRRPRSGSAGIGRVFLLLKWDVVWQPAGPALLGIVHADAPK